MGLIEFYGKLLAKHLTEIENFRDLHARYLYASDLPFSSFILFILKPFQCIANESFVMHSVSLSYQDTV